MIEANIAITNNADWTLPLCFVDEDGNPHDFSGSTFKAEIKVSPATAVIATLTSANGGVISTALPAGKITLLVASGAIVEGAYVYDLIRITGSLREKLMGGTLTVEKGVTG